jgi:hypothetical protein
MSIPKAIYQTGWVVDCDILWSTFKAVEHDMARTNLTLQVDTEVIRRARILAAKRGTSVSALAAQRLMELVEEDERFEAARRRALTILAKAVARGGRSWDRDDLHDRAGLAGR